MLRRLGGGEYYGEVMRSRTISGLILSETRYLGGTCLPRHGHEHAYFCLIRQGTYREDYGRRERTCGPAMLAFHPPEEVHSECFDHDDVRSFNIELTPFWLQRLAGRVMLDQPFDCRGGRLVGLAVRLLDEFDHSDASSPLIIEGLALELLGLCDREARGVSGAPYWLSRVRELLTERCTAPSTLTELAAEARVSPSHLANAFRRHFGCTVGAYARTQRIALACRELTDSNRPLVEIALLTGFADQSHFSRVFKRERGLTPAAYRKLMAGRAVRSNL